MTRKEIDLLFPPGYSGVAQISDLRLILTEISHPEPAGVLFEVVNSIPERDALEPVEGQICKVSNYNTYVYHNDDWVILVDGGGTSPGPNPTTLKTTDNWIISSLDHQNGYVDLTYVPNFGDHFFIFLNGMNLILGVGFDCTIANNRLYFNPGVLNTGDHLSVKYSY